MNQYAKDWYLSLTDDEREAVDERIAIMMESNGWTEEHCIDYILNEGQDDETHSND
jgi:hypothetical protein